LIKKKCFIYTRVSTQIQVDGYSLDAQQGACKRYADAMGYHVVKTFSDEGKSGKNTAGRPQFLAMLDAIANQNEKVDYIIVFKLSRFARNAADTISSVQLLQDYGVNLISIEDGIDTSKDSGKLLLSVLAAVYELERENIRVQTMAGRVQKAREGKWNGGFAPYGYILKNGELEIVEEEAEVVRIIYERFVSTTWGIAKIADYLNNNYKKVARKTASRDYFTAQLVVGVLDNPLYMGKMPYGRHKTVKIEGTRNEYKIRKQKEYPIYDGIHEAIISEEIWNLAQDRRKNTKPFTKIHSLDHEHILSGILKCPICGKSMYGNVNRKRHPKTGEFYKDHWYYACKHRAHIDGVPCSYHKQWNQEKVNTAVEEVIKKMVCNPIFADAIKSKINQKTDTSELEKELADLEKCLRQRTVAKDKVGAQIDNLDIEDINYERKYADFQNRLDGLYEEIYSIEEEIQMLHNRIKNIEESRITSENVYSFLLHFDKIYGILSDIEKKTLMQSFVEEVQIFENTQEDGKFLKSIKFSFPIPYEGSEIQEISWDNENTVECVCKLVRD